MSATSLLGRSYGTASCGTQRPMSEEADKAKRTFFLRVVGSALTFCVSAVLSVSWVLTQNPSLRYVPFAFLIGAVVLLPRRVPNDVAEALMDEVDGERRHARATLWLSVARMVYVVVTGLILFGLPELLH